MTVHDTIYIYMVCFSTTYVLVYCRPIIGYRPDTLACR